MKFEQFLEAVHPDTQQAWDKHFQKKNEQERLNQAKKREQEQADRHRGSQSNKAKE